MNNSEKKTIPVSVVIPCYRGLNTIERTVLSIMAQTVLPLEIICVDDFSNDQGQTWNKLLSIKGKYGEIIHLMQHQENKGSGQARNTGWDEAKGNYICFLDDDDIWPPEKLEIQYNFMKEHTDICLTGSSYGWLRKGNDFGIIYPRSPSFREIKRYRFLLRNPLCLSAVMLKRDIPLRFPSIKRAEDYYLWLVISKKYKIYRCDLPLSFILKPPFGVSGLGSDIKLMHEANIAIFKELLSNNILSEYEYVLMYLIEKLKFPLRKFKSIFYQFKFRNNKILFGI